jgi:ABC-type nitrate/sulfonate/bicarbonate transport system substrate-binding protein
MKAIEDLSKYPDWTLPVANIPAVITCTEVMAEQHPDLVVTFMKGMIKVGRWANEHKHAAAVPFAGRRGKRRRKLQRSEMGPLIKDPIGCPHPLSYKSPTILTDEVD